MPLDSSKEVAMESEIVGGFWKPAVVLFHPEHEFLMLLKDVRGWGSVAEVYLNRNVRQAVHENAIESAVLVNNYMESMYAR